MSLCQALRTQYFTSLTSSNPLTILEVVNILILIYM